MQGQVWKYLGLFLSCYNCCILEQKGITSYFHFVNFRAGQKDALDLLQLSMHLTVQHRIIGLRAEDKTYKNSCLLWMHFYSQLRACSDAIMCADRVKYAFWAL
jgi:hypothetical protein